MEFDIETNLSKLPLTVLNLLAQSFEHNNMWMNLFNNENDSAYKLSPETMENIKRRQDIGSYLLTYLGHRDQTVKTLLETLHAKAKIYGAMMERPQLILHRKFCPVIWARKTKQVLVSIVADGKQLKLECKASGFPAPYYQWSEEGKPMEDSTTSCLTILRCSCTARNVFRCKVWNEIEAGEVWSDFYRSNNKQYSSELVSDVVDLTNFLPDPQFGCESCTQNKVAEMYKMVNNVDLKNDFNHVRNPMMTTSEFPEELVATDKVALIISNRTYAPHMSNLITPHCDAATLAQALIELKFKTVTLGDLTLEELKFIVKEYKKLLGEGVYAVFYFVGHGFEANGQCYLLPIGATAGNYGPEDCLSMEWVMSVFQDQKPALNLILLDICRKFLPDAESLKCFAGHQSSMQKNFKVIRNMVYGYATSSGVGAYEVRGETNGVFIKYLKNRIHQKLPVLDMLKKVFRDIEKDNKVCDVQIPELRSNLTKSRSLLDPLIYTGHTTSYHKHTLYWQLIHELPNPVRISFSEIGLQVTVWYEFCGHFTNKVYVFSSVGDLRTESDTDDQNKPPSEHALKHIAHLTFPSFLNATQPKIFSDDEEGISLCILLSNLQKLKSDIKCTVKLEHRDRPAETVASKEISLGYVLIARLVDAS